MTTGQIVAIVVLVLLVALVVAAVLLRRRSPNVRRAEAAQHRQEAEQRRASAQRLEAEAAERAERARAEHAQAAKLAEMAAHDREVAEKAAAEAHRLDPDFHPEDDDRPAVAATHTDDTAGRTDRLAVPTGRDDRHTVTAGHDDRRAIASERTDRAAVTDGGERPAAPVAPRPRRADYNPEPIVGGAAEGMITPRRNRSADEHAAHGSSSDEAAETVPTPVPAQRTASEQENASQRTVGDAVRDRAETGGSSAATHDRPSLADRIMGRG
jgi:hypothetical protein